MITLGINSIYHDSAACLVRDGQVIAAVEEERFSRIKHQKRPLPYEAHALPFHAIDFCLQEAGINLSDVNHVAYSFNPFYLISPLQDQSFALPPDVAHFAGWEGYNEWKTVFLAAALAAPKVLLEADNLADHSEVPYHLAARFLGEQKYEFHFVDHHLCHSASAFLPSPFQRAAIMTLDGVGESATTTYGTGNGLQVEIFGEVHRPNSLGKFWEHVTAYLGFRRVSGEHKVMAMAARAKPRYLDQFLEIMQIRYGGSYVINPYDLEEEFGPARLPGQPLQERHFEIASSIQAALEVTVLELVNWLAEETGEENLCLAGGVALNSVLNSAIRDRGAFKNVWVQPAANDAGTALGAALMLDAQKSEGASRSYQMGHAYLGPGYCDEEIEALLRRAKVPYRRMNDVSQEVADLLVGGNIVGWFQGRMEFGPRALGARSILASPIDAAVRERLNELKGREDFRPLAPAVLEEKAAEWFDGGRSSPFMLFTFPVREDRVAKVPSLLNEGGLTAWIQTVSQEQNELFHNLLVAFEERTGVPILLNTSFSGPGQPIVCSPRHAIETFWVTPLDALAIGPFLLEKPK